MPLREKRLSPIITDLEVVGSDIVNFACPYCSCSDRERHLLMFFDQLDMESQIRTKRVLHFAPEPAIAARVVACGPSLYVKGDLHPWRDDIQDVDITRMPFDDCSFEFLVCNHILEHVEEDRLALSEITRVLSPGGYAILQTPYSPLISVSFEDPAARSEELRTRLFGQNDHVRVYGRDLFTRIADAGLHLTIRRHDEVLDGFPPATFGVNGEESVLLVVKPVASAETKRVSEPRRCVMPGEEVER